MSKRRLPAPWAARDRGESYLIEDANGQPLVFIYYEDEPTRQSVMKRLSKDEARRIAANIVKLPDLLKGQASPLASADGVRHV